ncbi:dihydrolipoyl dehydrogenase family protein [Streptomyces sp. NPDC101165]|uniref:dihydrolipoyl dehydrogenase family protein n=1 Tax=Streptomyces sp. NPDC101165 TaxID=3366119 RepID=UPI00381E91DB
MRELQVDVVVVGAGPAGENAAGRCADARLSVAVVERQLVGGECSYWGCIPSKTLLRPGDAVAAARRVPGAAEAVTGGVDAQSAFAQRDYMTSHWQDTGQAKWLADRNITLVRGAGRLEGDRVVEVTSEDGDTTQVTASRAVVLATGTAAAIPPVDGLRDIRVWDNRDATAAKELPLRLLVLGGGAIGAEMAQGFHRLGCPEVTVVEGTDRLVPREEPFAGEELRTAFEAEGITVITGVLLQKVRRETADAPVEATLADGRELVADEILVAVGRRPATADLGLDSVGLQPGRFVEVDDHMRATGVSGGWLYAIGDCNGRALLTHMGKYQARIASDVIIGKGEPTATDVIPRVTFTDPQVAAVGLTEEQARDQDLPVRTVSYGTGDVPGSYVRGNGLGGTSMLVVDTERRIVVGATFTGQDVQELLHSATVAVVGRVPLEVLGHAVPSFPTVSEVWLHLLEQCGV